MPDDRDLRRDLMNDERMQADMAGEPLTASVQDIVDEHADAARRAAEQEAAARAEGERVARHKADEARSTLRHTGGRRRLRPTRAVDVRRTGAGGPADDEASQGGSFDPRWLIGAAVAGVVLAGGIRRVLLLATIGAGAWALYRRVLEPARDPGVVLQ